MQAGKPFIVPAYVVDQVRTSTMNLGKFSSVSSRSSQFDFLLDEHNPTPEEMAA